MGTIYPKLQGKNIKISDVAEKITGIIFINDKSVTKSDGEVYETFIYLNPNATNKKLSRRDFDILNWSPKVKQPFIDEFNSQYNTLSVVSQNNSNTVIDDDDDDTTTTSINTNNNN